MNNTEILEEFSVCNDHKIVKGKRSKRLRPSSSAPSSGGGEIDFSSLLSTPTSSSGISTTTEEDGDVANCLILLARGGLRTGEENVERTENRSGNRRFTETATATMIHGGEAGINVYECRTCSRTFPSFQALGGHRAGHKKPKQVVDDDRKKYPQTEAAAEIEAGEGKFITSDAVTRPIPTRLPNRCLIVGNKPKIHECSICGSEFASGQALGGHMRRHRSAAISVNTTKSPNTDGSSRDEIGEKRRNMMLEFDLNLPAAQEDDRCDTEFQDDFVSNQQTCIVFSAAALVDCHY
ncbi:hypothetical protein OROGR_024597 [Orobanche gracilis]